MERLTLRSSETSHENGVCCTHFKSQECLEVGGNCAYGCKWEEAAWEKLASYEDSMLPPEGCKAAAEAPIRDYRPENAPFVTANGKPVGLLKSIRPDITEIVISTSYCGCEFVNGELASVEILKEPLDKWEERYGKAIDDSKVQ